MEVTEKDIQDFADTGDEDDLRAYVKLSAEMLNRAQFRHLQAYFSRSLTFTLPKGKVAPQPAEMPHKRTVDDEDEDDEMDDTDQLLQEAKSAQQGQATQPVGAPDQPLADKSRTAGRPPLTPREIAEREFEEIVRRRKAP
jgi:hypothetical protein